MNQLTDFVIHEHNARKAGLHYDLRIKFGYVLKDWAFRKPIPLESGLKRLGISQPDHDLGWLDFEGSIEDGYGAGELKIWDKGKIEILEIETERKIVGNFLGNRIFGKYIFVKSSRLKGWLIWKT